MRWGAIVATAILVLLLTFCHRLNRPPTVPEPVYPPDGATGVPIDATLTWRSMDPDGDPITFTVFLNGEEVSQTTETYLRVSLEIGKDYSWSVTARDVYGNEVEGATWTFRTVDPDVIELPPGPVFPILSFGGVLLLDLTDPSSPGSSEIDLPTPTIAVVKDGKLYSGGCGWFKAWGRDIDLNGCVEDAAVADESIFVALGEDGLVKITPSTVVKILDGYVNGVDYDEGILAITRGDEGLFVSPISSPSSLTEIYGSWSSKPSVWKGRVYALISRGVIEAYMDEESWKSSVFVSDAEDYSVWNGNLFVLEDGGIRDLGSGRIVKGIFKEILAEDGYILAVDNGGAEIYFIGEGEPVLVHRVGGNYIGVGKIH